MILLVFDVETTGLDKTKDHIIQFSGIKVDTDTNDIVDELNLYIQPLGNYSMSLGAVFKHRIMPDFLKDKPIMSQVAPKIVEFFNGVDNILTYNGNSFDIPFLKNELNKCGYVIDFMSKNCYDAFITERERHGISLDKTFKRYKGKTMEEAGLTAHDALSDIKATYDIFAAQQKEEEYAPVKMYGEDNVISEMMFCEQLKPCFNYGKYRGVSLDWVKNRDRGYLEWCVNKSNFMDSTKEYIKTYLV